MNPIASPAELAEHEPLVALLQVRAGKATSADWLVLEDV